ncbi:TetR/AcrR family transcriptional regulator [Cupriavidus sp. amp6]|uniref:TetR/AcrR family transcriptional regulator n=1 Tax=Cupriavidus sp. amp6 TaxID=388051 RepID=UPI0003FCD365|nr:TetR/AcrR family transcriptional regulator [Cupriavidus sp. amp6]
MTETTPSALPSRGPADHNVRSQIVEAATEHFSLYGYEKTTVSDLAKAIGFSKAYIYKFFDSKQAIGEVICANCLGAITNEVDDALAAVPTASERLRRLFKTLVDAGVRLFFQDRKLYAIAAAAAQERWQPVLAYEDHIRNLVMRIILEGRKSGEFERKTPLDETANGIYLVMRPYIDPLLLQHNLDVAAEAHAQLSSLILRSLAP